MASGEFDKTLADGVTNKSDPTTARNGFNADELIDIVQTNTDIVKQKINTIRDNKSAISIADMFDMQMLMNHLSQLTEMSSGVVSAANASIMKLAGGISR